MDPYIIVIHDAETGATQEREMSQAEIEAYTSTDNVTTIPATPTPS